MPAVTWPGQWLEADQVLRLADRPVAGLLLDLALRGVGRRLAFLDQTAEQLVAPLVGREPVSPQHQHAVAFVHDQSYCDPCQVDDVVLPPLAVRSLHVREPELHPLVVVDQPLTEGLPGTVLLLSHARQLRACW